MAYIDKRKMILEMPFSQTEFATNIFIK